jgi:hypothetical protein
MAAAVAFSLWIVGQRCWLDDSFISYRYAKNLFEGLGLVYNSGERVEGYTNFLWILVSYLSLCLELEPIHFTQSISLLAQAATLWLVYKLGIHGSGSHLRGLIAPILLAGHVTFLVYPMTGMETTFFTALVTLAFYLYRRQVYRSWAGTLILIATLLGLGLTRFDGFVLVFILASYPVLVQRKVKSTIPALALSLVGLLAYNIWRSSYYPTLLPNSFHAKIDLSLSSMLQGLRYMARYVTEGGQLTAVLAALPFALGRSADRTWHLAWVVLAHFAYVTVVGGDWMPHFRFLLPVLPLFYLLSQEGIWQVWDSIRPALRHSLLSGSALLAILFGCNELLLLKAMPLQFSPEPFHPHDARLIGLHLQRTLPKDKLVAIEWGGILPFHTHHQVLDTFGITDARITKTKLRKTVWGRSITAAYLASRRPDLIVPCARIFPSEAAALRSVRPNEACAYSYFMSLNSRELGYEVAIQEIGRDAYWPSLVRR